MAQQLAFPKPHRGAAPKKRPALTKKAQQTLVNAWATAITAHWGFDITALHRNTSGRGQRLYWLTVVSRTKGCFTLSLVPRQTDATAFEVTLWYGGMLRATWDVPDQATGEALSPEILAVLDILCSVRGAAASS